MPWVVVADADMLRQRSRWAYHCKSTTILSALPLQGPQGNPHTVAEQVQPGQLNPDHAPAVLAALDHAIAGAMSGTFHALVTGPMQKSAINDAGLPFSGHTEYLAQAAAADDVVMLLMSDDFEGRFSDYPLTIGCSCKRSG